MMTSFFERSKALEDNDDPSATSWLTAIVFLTELGTVDEILRQQDLIARVDLSPISAFDRCRILRFRCHSLRVAGDTVNAVVAGKESYDFAVAHRLFHDARLTAELLSFLFLDQNDLENAALWISLASETTADSEYSATSPSLLHAQDRLLLQRGEFAEVAKRLSSRLPAIRKDGTIRNRSGELSTLALCLAHTGQHEPADALLRELLSELPSIYGSFSADYPVEVASRALSTIGRLEESREQSAGHIREKLARRDRPLPAFYEGLQSARDELASRDGNELSRVT
jgi:tetratricopeptide (TPR) repeat protein